MQMFLNIHHHLPRPTWVIKNEKTHMNEHKVALGHRIRQIRQSLDMSQTEFAELLGVDQRRISRMEIGVGKLETDHIKFFEDKYSVSQKWILNGIGPMHTDGRSEVIVANPPYAQSSMEAEENKYLKKRISDLEKQIESQNIVIDRLTSTLEKIAK